MSTEIAFARTDEDYARGTYTVSRICVEPDCSNITTAKIEGAHLFRYNQGALVHEAFPELNADEREALFQSGICPKCWDKLFADEDEED